MWLDLFINTFDSKILFHIKNYSSERNFKFGEGEVLKSLFYIGIPVLVTGENVLIRFDVVYRYLPLLLEKNIKEGNLTINTGKVLEP